MEWVSELNVIVILKDALPPCCWGMVTRGKNPGLATKTDQNQIKIIKLLSF